jgi:hypothetical protein
VRAGAGTPPSASNVDDQRPALKRLATIPAALLPVAAPRLRLQGGQPAAPGRAPLSGAVVPAGVEAHASIVGGMHPLPSKWEVVMIALVLRLVASSWLFVSAFVLEHSTMTAWNALVVACLVAAVSFLAFAMPGRPGIRWWNAVLATWLMATAILMPHVSLGTMLHDVGVGMVIAALSLPAPAAWLRHWREEHAGAAAR